MYNTRGDSLPSHREKLNFLNDHKKYLQRDQNQYRQLQTPIQEIQPKFSFDSVTGIQVMEADMWKVIEDLRNNESFAHTISR